MEWWLLISVLVNAWQFYDRGELKAEMSQYKGIAQQCAESRKEQKQRAVEAYELRRRIESDTRKVLEGSKLDPRKADSLAGDIRCPGVGRVFSGLADHEAQRTNQLIELRLRTQPTPNQR